jgi:hypothetical protein
MRLNDKMIANMARTAGAAIVANPPSPDVLITRAQVYAAGGFPAQPNDATWREGQAWKLSEVAFTEAVRDVVMAGAGRWLRTAPGEGFLLLSPLESVQYGVASTVQRIGRAIQRGQSIVDRAGVTDAEGQAAQLKAQARMGTLAQGHEAQRQELERERKLAEATAMAPSFRRQMMAAAK